MKVYKPLIVNELELFYKSILIDIESFPSIHVHLKAVAEKMWEGVQVNHPSILREISNYHSFFLGKKNEELKNISLTYSDCLHAIANEHGFKNWKVVEQLEDLQYDFEFEKTVNALLEGNFEMVKNQISNFPKLLFTKSKYGHQATLLHYTANNGVEMWRQKIPLNLVEITSYLLERGADENAKMKVYGGEFDTYSLLVTSAHPHEAGIMEKMKKVFASTE